MNEKNQVSYYSIIPATVRYDNKLKPAEKILYGVTIHTISRWVSNLEKQGYIDI